MVCRNAPDDKVAALSALGALDAGSADDREWFKRHIGRNHRLRKPIGAERLLFEPGRGFKPMIVVKQLEPGQRGRVPFGWRKGEPLLNAESVAERVFWLAVEGANVTIVERVCPPLEAVR
jgi:hypothetical protein